MPSIKMHILIWQRRLDTILFRLWFWRSIPEGLRHLLYLHRHGQQLTTWNLPEYYLKHWLIDKNLFDQYTYQLITGEAKNIIPYAVATYAYSRFSDINTSKKYRRGIPFIKPFSYTLELWYPNDWNFIYFRDFQETLLIIQRERTNNTRLSELWLFNCFK